MGSLSTNFWFLLTRVSSLTSWHFLPEFAGITTSPRSDVNWAYCLKSSAISICSQSSILVKIVRIVRNGGLAEHSINETNFPETLSSLLFLLESIFTFLCTSNWSGVEFIGSIRAFFSITWWLAEAKRIKFPIRWTLGLQKMAEVKSYIWTKGCVLKMLSLRVWLSLFALILSNCGLVRESIIAFVGLCPEYRDVNVVRFSKKSNTMFTFASLS